MENMIETSTRPRLNPLIRVLSWALRPLQNELNAALEDELAIVQRAVRRARDERDKAYGVRDKALEAVDDVTARNGQLHRQIEELNKGLPEIDQALAALRSHRRCDCQTGRGDRT